jgi:O-antigen/teichoic acid export membrane protein
MREHFSTLAKQTLVYGISSAALQIVGMFTLPVFARVFSPDEYGTLEIATAALGALLVIADLGMISATQRSYFDYADSDRDPRARALATGLAAAVLTAAVLSIGLMAFRAPIAGWLLHDRAQTELVVLVAVALPLSILANFLRQVMRLRFMPWHYSASAVTSALLAGAVGIALVLAAGSGVDGVFIGVVVGNLVAVIMGLAITARYIGVRLSRRELRVMLAYGLPLIPAASAMWGLAFLDRVMLSRLANLNEVGQYAVGARLASALMLVVTAFGLAYSPFMLAMYAEDKEVEKAVRARTLTYVCIVLTALSLAFALFAREIITVIAPDYTEAYEVVGILCVGVTVFGLSSVTMAGISLMRRTGYFALFSIVAVVVNVVLNLVLIPPLGGSGAALATACAYVALTGLYYHRAQALYPTAYRPGKTLAVLALGVALMPLGFLPLGLGAVAVKLLALAAFAAIVLFAILDRPEISEIRSLGRRFTRPAATPR